MVVRGSTILVALVALALASCSSGDGGEASDLGFTTVEPTGAALEIAGVWTIDIADTVAAVTRDAALSPRDAKALTAMLEHTNTQLALYRDGAFVLKNLRADAGGTVTVEGAWTLEQSVLRLRGHKENGRLREPPKDVSYRMDSGRLIRVADASPGSVMPVLRRSLVW